MDNNYKYFKFVGGKYFRMLDETHFQVINNDNMWEDDDMIYFLYNDLGMDYEEITDNELLNKLKSLPIIDIKEKKL